MRGLFNRILFFRFRSVQRQTPLWKGDLLRSLFYFHASGFLSCSVGSLRVDCGIEPYIYLLIKQTHRFTRFPGVRFLQRVGLIRVPHRRHLGHGAPLFIIRF